MRIGKLIVTDFYGMRMTEITFGVFIKNLYHRKLSFVFVLYL
jgi:hypothetical protein